MADVVLSAREGYAFSDAPDGDSAISPVVEKVSGIHGYDPNEPMLHATFVAWGAGIRPGSNAGTITSTSVAPTIAALLGLTMENTDGRPLATILAN